MHRLLLIGRPSRWLALVESLATTLIWASSFVFVKMGLTHVGPLTLAGLRYFLGFVALLPLVLRNGDVARSLPTRVWLRLCLIGLSAYTIGNGALFWGLTYLPATTGSFLMSLSPVLILFAGSLWLKEIPGRLQVVGVVVTLIGSGLFFSPGLRAGELVGIGIVGVGLIGFTLFGILGREVARDGQVGTLALTALPLAFGGGLLLLGALPLEGLPVFPASAWGIVLWLAVVNTALAYMLYNHALQSLTALEMNVMLNLSPLGTALLAWLLLGEQLSAIQVVGLVTVIVGVIVVQWGKP